MIISRLPPPLRTARLRTRLSRISFEKLRRLEARGHDRAQLIDALIRVADPEEALRLMREDDKLVERWRASQ